MTKPTVRIAGVAAALPGNILEQKEVRTLVSRHGLRSRGPDGWIDTCRCGKRNDHPVTTDAPGEILQRVVDCVDWEL